MKSENKPRAETPGMPVMRNSYMKARVCVKYRLTSRNQTASPIPFVGKSFFTILTVLQVVYSNYSLSQFIRQRYMSVNVL